MRAGEKAFDDAESALIERSRAAVAVFVLWRPGRIGLHTRVRDLFIVGEELTEKYR